MITNPLVQNYNITKVYPPFIVNILEPDINIDNTAPFLAIPPPSEVMVEPETNVDIDLGAVLDTEGDECWISYYGIKSSEINDLSWIKFDDSTDKLPGVLNPIRVRAPMEAVNTTAEFKISF